MQDKCLPFQRGSTFNADSWQTLDDDTAKHLEGKIYEVEDTVHGSGIPIRLMIVKNDSGAAITVARKFFAFSASSAYDFGRRISGINSVAGGVAVPLDDKYTVGGTIAQYDLFYVVVRGWVSVLTDSSATSLAAGLSVASTNAGLIKNGAASSSERVLGRLTKQASYSASTATAIWVDLEDLNPPYGSA